jgi:RNA polymerase sigma-70 factor (ECF subfamily)
MFTKLTSIHAHSPPRPCIDDPAGLDDAALVRAVARNDASAFAALHARKAPELLRRALRLTGHREDAREVVQEVFLQIWRGAASYDPARGSVGAWLMILVRSRAVDQLRWRQVHCPDPSSPRARLLAATVSPDSLPAADTLTIRRACSSLPWRQREVVQMAYFQGLTCDEAADALAIPVGTMKWRMASALDTLRTVLGADSSSAWERRGSAQPEVVR